MASNSSNGSYNSIDFRGKMRLYKYMARVDEQATERLHGIATEAEEHEEQLRLSEADGALAQLLFEEEQQDEEMMNEESGGRCNFCGGALSGPAAA